VQHNNSTKIKINKVKIRFTTKKLTAYGGFSLLAAFFEKIRLREAIQKAIPVKEVSPNGIGIYSKMLAYSLVLYAGVVGFRMYFILKANRYYQGFLPRTNYPRHLPH